MDRLACITERGSVQSSLRSRAAQGAYQVKRVCRLT